MKTQIHELRTRIDGISQLVMSAPEGAKRVEFNSDSIPSERMVKFILQNKDEYHYTLEQVEKCYAIYTDYKHLFIPVISQELKECHKSLLLAKAWLGKVLAELGEETPYQSDGNRKSVEDIEPTADRFKVPELIDCGLGFDWNEASYIEKIDWLREEIEETKGLMDDLADDDGWYDVADILSRTEAHLAEARFFLGFELSRLKEQSK